MKRGLTPRQCRKLRCYTEQALEELSQQQLEVVLIPAPDPRHTDHKIRVAINRNPRWYSEFYASRLSGVKKFRVMRALERLYTAKPHPRGYEQELAKIVRETYAEPMPF